MTHPSSYPSPPYSQPEYTDAHATRSLYGSAWQVLEQPSPPTIRDILNAYKSKGDGDRDMLLAMLNAKSAEDQRIAAIATLHQKLLEVHVLPRPLNHDHVLPNHADNIPSLRQSSTSSTHQPASTSNNITHSSSRPKIASSSVSSSSSDVTLPSIRIPQSPRKRARTSRSPPPLKRRHSEEELEQQMIAPSDQLPPSPPFSSPGRSTLCPELTAHQPPRDAMAIGSLLSSGSIQQDADSDWPSRTSSEREREGHRRPAKVSA